MRTIVIPFAGVLTLVSAGAVLLDYLSTRGPSPELCAAQWDAPTNGGDRAIAADQDRGRAVASGWLAKERYPGCGVLVRGDEGEPWLSFSGFVHGGRIRVWDRVSGERWGYDSPEGGPETPNATLTGDGHVVLEG